MKSEMIRVLVPLDGSLLAESILPALMPLASRQPVGLHLLQVVDQAGEMEAARAYLARLGKDLRRDRVESVSRIEFGHPVEEILHRAKSGEFDLVAMTTHGRGGLRRVFMGSVAEGVLRHATIPLLINRPGTTIGDWNRVVVPLDGSKISETILDEAARLAILLRATLHVVRVTLPLLPTTDLYFRPLPEVEENPQPYLDEVCDRLAARGILAVPVCLHGFAGQEIVRYASKIGAGLIAMMTEGRTGVPRMLSGSVAEEVLRSATCPVLVRRWSPVQAEVPLGAADL